VFFNRICPIQPTVTLNVAEDYPIVSAQPIKIEEDCQLPDSLGNRYLEIVRELEKINAFHIDKAISDSAIIEN